MFFRGSDVELLQDTKKVHKREKKNDECFYFCADDFYLEQQNDFI